MRILHVINNLEHGGAEALLTDVAPVLVARGHETHVATLFAYSQPVLRERLAGTQVCLHSMGFRWRYDPRIPAALGRLVHRLAPDVVHAHLFPTLYWTAIVRRGNALRVVTEHSQRHKRRTRTILRIADRWIHKRYDRIVCISETVRSELLSCYPELSDRACVVHNGIALERYRDSAPVPRTALALPEGVLTAAMVGRLEPPKDQATVIRALARVPELYLVLVGQGPHESSLRSLAESLGVANRVRFLGHRADVPAVLKACDFLVHSSAHEGFCLAVVEAMACGLPVIVSDIPVMREIMRPGQHGLVFPPGNAETLAQALTAMTGDRGLLERMARLCMTQAERFSIARTVDGLLNVYSGGQRPVLRGTLQ